MNKRTASFLSTALILASCISTRSKQNTHPPLENTNETTTAPEESPVSTTSQIEETSEPTTSPIDVFAIPWDDRSVFSAGLVESAQDVLTQLDGASVYHIEFSIQDSIYEIDGNEEILYTNTEEVPLNEIQLRLFPNILGGEMSVNNMSIDGSAVDPSYDLNNSLLIVPVNPPLEPGKSIVLYMDFDVAVTQVIETNYGVQAFAEDVLALAHAYPMIPVYDDEGWNAEIPPESGDVTYADASFFLVKVHAPADLVIATTGMEVSRETNGSTQTLSIAGGPARDFYLAASKNYSIVEHSYGEITIRSFAPEGREAGAKFTLDAASKAIEFYSKRYAPYPYTELDFVTTPTYALGIEYPGAIAITGWTYDLNGSNQDTNTRIYLESTVAHEVGHQWFYGLVGNDQLDDPWLDESLTQFVTLQYYTDRYGPSGGRGFEESVKGRWNRIDNALIPIGMPVASYSGQEYSSIIYGRGPLFFLALRDEMGTEAFDLFLKEYTQTLSWGIATPEFLMSLAEQKCECNLNKLFGDWVY